MKLGQIVGKGTSSEVYDIGDGKVFKLFLPGYPQQMIGYEARVSKTVHEAGVRCPKPFGVEEHDGRQGIVYEKIEGPAFLRILGPQAYKLVPYARLLSNLQKSFHKLKGLDLPSQKLLFKDWIEIAPHLSDARKDRVLGVLESLPDGDALCHNDFHPDNIIMSKSGPVIIDWVNARVGDPMADAAITHLIIKKGHIYDDVKGQAAIAVFRQMYGSCYRSFYLAGDKELARRMDAWLLVAAATRLIYNFEDERPRLMKTIDRLLP